MAYRAFTYRLYPSPSQKRLLEYNLAAARNWYNMCLEERQVAWEQEQRSVSKGEQQKKEKYYNKTFCTQYRVHSHVIQTATDDLDKAFQKFFRRVKHGEKAGYPRFKSQNYRHSFGYKQADNGFKIDGRRLKLSYIGRIRVWWHRELQGKVKTCRIKRRAGKWYVTFFCEVVSPKPLSATGKKVGLDVGISKLFTTSDGYSEENPNYYRQGQCRLRVLQRKLARAERGSNNCWKVSRQVQRQHAHVKDQRKDFLDKLVFNLIKEFDFIALEDLKIRNMVRNQHLSKSILDSGWGYFKKRLLDKAAEAGRVVVLVDPAYTSSTCSRCGAPLANLTLADRWVSCPCGMSLDRDHNAAINILDKAECMVSGKKWVGRAHEP